MRPARSVAALVAIIIGGWLLSRAEVTVFDYDLILQGGKIIDGTGNLWYHADVGVKGERIAKIGRLKDASAERTIDARGLIVAPGFIDMLGQSETNLLIDSRALSKITQGITTEITGEGGSIAPINVNILKEMKPYLDHFKLTVDWRTFDQYFTRLTRQGTTINFASYVGATQVREYVMGRANRTPEGEELGKMKTLVAQAMKDGAVGLSSALVYAPAFYASTAELVELAKVAAQYGGIYATHMRNEGNSIFKALDEAITIGERAQLPVEIFHLKVAGKANWGKMGEVVKAIEAARARGLDVTADQYPYIAGATGLSACIPPWAHAGGAEKLLARLRDTETRRQLRQEIETSSTEWENFYFGSGGAAGVLVNSVLNPALKSYEGKTLLEIGKLRHQDPLDALFDVLVEDKGQTGAIYFFMSEEDVKTAMKQPWVSFGSDYGAVAPDGVLGEDKAHPRAYGMCPRILGKYVRDEKIMPLEEAIRKMTSLAAQRLKIPDRGIIKEAMFADITVFDFNAVKDVATFENPNRFSEGIRYVLVNGQLVLDNGKPTGKRPGKALRGPGYVARKT
jgi:dihydroorotase/N-acyl-D-amino-acid deacylase